MFVPRCGWVMAGFLAGGLLVTAQAVAQSAGTSQPGHGANSCAQPQVPTGQASGQRRYMPPSAPDCSKAPASQKARCEIEAKANPGCAKTAQTSDEYSNCIFDAIYQAAPPQAPDCSKVTPDKKASCDATAKVYPLCAGRAKTGQEFSSCVRNEMFKVSPPKAPDCSHVQSGTGKANCEALAKKYYECLKGAMTLPRFETCMCQPDIAPPRQNTGRNDGTSAQGMRR